MKLKDWEDEIDKEFISEPDNDNDMPVRWLFKVNPDGTRTIALPVHLKDFIRRLLDEQRKELATELRKIQANDCIADMIMDLATLTEKLEGVL